MECALVGVKQVTLYVDSKEATWKMPRQFKLDHPNVQADYVAPALLALSVALGREVKIEDCTVAEVEAEHNISMSQHNLRYYTKTAG